MRKHTLTAGDHVLVVGFGPVAVRLVEELLPLVETGRLRLTVLGAEDRPGYNRVLVGEYGVGRLDAEGLELLDVDDWRRRGVRVELGTRVDWLDRSARQAHAGEQVIDYDIVVLAVGARPNVPNLRGLNPDPTALAHLPEGVTPLRTAADADRLRDTVATGGRVVVLGGGVLGLEVALAAREAGCPVSVVHAAPWLLTRSCDRIGGAMLDRAVAERRLRVIPDAVAREVLLDERRRFRGLRLADGQVIAGELLVLSCGVRAETRIAEGAGLSTEAGIVVNHELEADPQARVFAIGDCAQVRCSDPVCTVCPGRSGGPAGLIAPGWQQAEWLAVRWRTELDPETGPVEPMPTEEPTVVRLKARGLEVVAAGETAGEPWEHDPDPAAPRVAHWVDGVGGRFLKVVVRGGRLAGFVAIGLPRAAAELAVLRRTGAEVPADPSLLLRLDAPPGGNGNGAGTGDANTPLCRCAGVPEEEVCAAIEAGADSVAVVRRETRAGSGCGGCGDRVRALLLDWESARAVP